MFVRVLLLLSFLIPISSVHAQDVEAKRKLGVAGQALGKALAMHDQAALEKLWSPQMIVNGPNNSVLTRAEIFEGKDRLHLEIQRLPSCLEKQVRICARRAHLPLSSTQILQSGIMNTA